MSDDQGPTPPWIERIGNLFSIRRSFRSKLLVALLGCVGLVVGATYAVVQAETRGQIREATERAAEQARKASAELEELRRVELTRLGRFFTESPRTLAILESVLESDDPDFRDVLVQDLRYELERQQLGASLAAFTGPAGGHVFTLLHGRDAASADTAAVEPLAEALLERRVPDLVAYRMVGGRPFMVRVIPLQRAGSVLGTATLGLPVGDSAAARIADVVGAQVCFVLEGRCVVRSPGADDTLLRAMAGVAVGSEPVRKELGGRRWTLVSEPLSPDWTRAGRRVVAVPLEAVTAPFERISRALRIAGALALVGALIAALALSRGLSRPVRKLVAAASRIGAGEYDARVEIESRDEMARLGKAFNEMAEDLALKERYRGVLDKVVSREVADELLKGEVVLGGENREVTTLFADVAGFTGLTEGMEPQGVISLLNQCMERLSAAVEAEQGVVDKFVGDEIMAIFGAPVGQDDHATSAVRAAVRIQEAMKALSRERQERGEAPLSVSVGLNSGPVVAGNMGSPERLNYTVLGDMVNLAARVCAAARGGEILVTGRTLERTGSVVEADSLGSRTLKGFSEQVELFRVEGLADGERPERGGSSPAGAPGRRGRSPGTGAALLAAAAVTLSVPTLAAQEPGGLPTLDGLGATWISRDGSNQIQLSGRLDLEAYLPSDAEPWLVPETDPFVAGRLRLFADVFLGSRAYGLVELRADRGEEPRAGPLDARVDQAFVRVHPLDGRSLGVRLGKFASPVGSYPRRHHTEDDPFIRPPPAYDRRTVVSPWTAPPSTTAFLGWKDDPARFRPGGSPPVWGVPYQWGAALSGRLGSLSLEGAVVNSAPSNPPTAWSLESTFRGGPSWALRATLPVVPELRITGFYDRGPYLVDEFQGPLPAGREEDDFVQEMGGVSVVFARGRATLRGEVLAERWEVPNVEEAVEDLAYYVEGSVRPTAGFFLAARWGQLLFGGLGPGGAAWDHDFSRLQLGGGYRIVRNLEVRAEYAVNRTAGPRDPDDDLASLQIWWSF